MWGTSVKRLANSQMIVFETELMGIQGVEKDEL